MQTLLGWILSSVGGLMILVCLILVWVKMFQNGKTGLAILFIVLTCCGIGMLVTFIYGWVKSGEWNIRNIMWAWTAGLVLSIIGAALNPAQYTDIQRQIQQQQVPNP